MLGSIVSRAYVNFSFAPHHADFPAPDTFTSLKGTLRSAE